ncbi:hypothetical protein [Hymenobacter negativus]|uniref:Uncharacterized protein n=1 Tax=Hymenobacter negativus TaxID=2795026 RepID=A0ABS0Q9C8_9BACT|nr:hypothetical protein [Hymenobacter negativus]MBH8559230.1 hypothetical protein [Hymenobacter negativus]
MDISVKSLWYKTMRELGQSPEYYSPEMRQKYAVLKEQLESGTDGPDFPWDEYERLVEKDWHSRLHEGGMAKRFFLEIKAELAAYTDEVNRFNKYPLTRANEHKQLVIINRLEKKKALLDAQMDSLDRIIKAEQELFGLHLPPSAPSTPASSASIIITLESLCYGEDIQSQEDLAKKIDKVWGHVKGKLTRVANSPAACAGVYKLLVWLGKLHYETPSSDWKAAIQERYGVIIPKGVDGYRIEPAPNSKPFTRAVWQAYSFIKATYPGWVAGKNLPPVYRNLPTLGKG